MAKQQKNLFVEEEAPWELDDVDEQRVASIVFAEKPYGPYDYRVPERLVEFVEPGMRVEVPLGRGKRTVTGYCVDVETKRVPERKLKDIVKCLDETNLLSQRMLTVTRWMSDYYLCPLGLALDTALPAGVRKQAGTRESTLLTVPGHVSAQLATLKLTEKQRHVLETLTLSKKPLTPPQLAKAAGCTLSPIQTLRKRGLIEAEYARLQTHEVELPSVERTQKLQMNQEQQAVLDVVLNALDNSQHVTALIHGVTGSGKTEVYLQAIEEVVASGRQAIVLVPEISLTPQTQSRFRARFDEVAVLHSHQTDVERNWHWQRIARGEVQVVIGARSAVFAPTPQLGLIILDEEHDASFKQDIAPRYHARDVAEQRATVEKIPLLLGSATPSLETFDRATAGRYQWLRIRNRVNAWPLPDVSTIDLRTDHSSRKGAISRPLLNAMKETLRERGQVILLLNRRGFATVVQCPGCGEVLKCQYCDMSMTLHRDIKRVVCHYCDFQRSPPSQCPACDFVGIDFFGRGTQRLEQEIVARFPDYRCLRMDSDTMRKPRSHELALDEFRSGKAHILVGTQMIAKGLDFPNVTLVGVVNADTALHLPDFRSAERTFQLVTQVAGRTGRGEKGGRVIVQTSNPEHQAIMAATRHDFIGFARHELALREQYGYPPHTSLIRLIIRGENEQEATAFTAKLAGELKPRAGSLYRVLGPAPAPVAKLRGMFRFHVLVIGDDLDRMRSDVQVVTSEHDPPKSVQWTVDVDPVSLM